MTIDINQYQSISINRLILEIDEQSMMHVFVIIRMAINFQYQSITCDRLYRLPSIVIGIGFYFWEVIYDAMSPSN